MNDCKINSFTERLDVTDIVISMEGLLSRLDDEMEAPGEIGAHLDLAICRLCSYFDIVRPVSL